MDEQVRQTIDQRERDLIEHLRIRDEKIEVLEHDIAFLGRALVKVLEVIEYYETGRSVQKMVDFYEAKAYSE